MFELTRIEIAVTMTSTLTKKAPKDTHYYDPSEILEHTAGFCQNVILDHTYLPQNFGLL